MATTTLQEQVEQRAKADAALFVAEFGEPIDTAKTDWDATAWVEAVRELSLSNADAETLWPVYQVALSAETERLASKTPLVSLLETIDDSVILSDGAQDWDAPNLIDALLGADEPDTAEYVQGTTEDGRITISRLGDDGYIQTPPIFVEKRNEGTPYGESVVISDDSGQRRYDAGEHPTVEACIADYYRGRCRTVTDVREHLESADGYGYIEIDGERVLDMTA